MPKVLIVDDSRLARSVLRAQVESVGYSVVEEANDGADAVSAYLRLRPDIVMLDLNMPSVNGLEALHLLRQADATAHVVVVSAIGNERTVLQAIRLGAAGYLLKPTDRMRVAQTLAKFAAPDATSMKAEWEELAGDLGQIFQEEASHDLDKLGQGLARLREPFTSRRSLANDFSRIAHSLKSGGALMGRPLFVEVAAATEKMSDQLANSSNLLNHAALDLLEQAVATLRQLLDGVDQSESDIEMRAQSLIWRIERWMAGVAGARPTAATR